MNSKLYHIFITLCFSLILVPFGKLKAQDKDFVPKEGFDEVFKAIRESKATGKPVKVLHLGDSHIKKGYCTEPIREALQKRYGELINVESIGINGATFVTFSSSEHIENIASFNPDLMIVSLGTNDSYTPRFSANQMKFNMQVFFHLLREKLPNLPVILTSPPASYLRNKVKIRRRRYRTYYTFNRSTPSASNTINYIAHNEGCGFIDIHQRYGSLGQAEKWLNEGVMNKDHVHYSAEGYRQFGQSIAEALIKFIEQSQNAKQHP